MCDSLKIFHILIHTHILDLSEAECGGTCELSIATWAAAASAQHLMQPRKIQEKP